MLQDAENNLQHITQELTQHKSTFDAELYKTYATKIQEKTQLDSTLSTLKVTIKNKLEKLEKLQQHEYDPNCKYCVSNVFVKDAIDTKSQLEDDKKTVHDFLQKLKGVSDFIEQNNFIQVQADEIQALLKQLQNAKNDD